MNIISSQNSEEMLQALAWSIGVLKGPDLQSLMPVRGIVNPIIRPSDVTDCCASFVADPFAIKVTNKWYLFFEIFDRALNRGVIAYADSADGIVWTYRRVVLKEPYHLSYPYVFRHRDKIFMVPEGRKGGAVRLYVAQDFPHKWQEVRVLLNGKYKDSSLVFYEGLWWMFAGIGAYSQQLFWSTELHGPWQRHRKWFTQLHKRSKARPGGRVVEYQGKLLRFAQDNRQRYGHQLRAFVIDTLSTSQYKEHELQQEPILCPSGSGWNSVGMHHMDPWLQEDGSWLAFVDGEGPTNSL